MMPSITLQIPHEKKETLQRKMEDSNEDIEEYIESLINQRREFEQTRKGLYDEIDKLQAENTELKIENKQLEEKKEQLSEQDNAVTPPWPVRWWQWARSAT